MKKTLSALSVISTKFFALSFLVFVATHGVNALASAANPAFKPVPPSDGGNTPEPASIALLLMGAGAVGTRIVKSRKNKNVSNQT